VILRLRAAFSALTSDRVRRVIIAGRRAGALSRAVGARAVLLAGVAEGAQRATAAATVAAQGQRRSSRSWVRRPDRVRRPAMASSRRRSVLGSATRSGLDNESVWVQVRRSQARRTIATQTALEAVVVERQVGQAGVFGAAYAVSGAAAAVPQFQVGQMPAAGVGGEAGDPPLIELPMRISLSQAKLFSQDGASWQVGSQPSSNVPV
jgi:hypothetical protein